MNLYDLKLAVDEAVERALENGESAHNIVVSIQIDSCNNGPESIFCNDVELCYDHDTQCSGCCIFGEMTGKG